MKTAADNIPGTHPALPCGVPGKNFFDEVVSMVEEIIAEEEALGGQSKVIDFALEKSGDPCQPAGF
ncbi:MAG: hypothetical protein HY897_20090 [Deltaproteobacteria bacterium]|nr:hypothetical protein [Deltaproteobacteria bacterium]